MAQHSVPFEDGEFTFRVSPVSLDDFEKVNEALNLAFMRFRAAEIRAFVELFVPAALPQRNDVALTVADFGALDPNLILSLGIQWLKGVRDVPLPLPLPPSDSTESGATNPES